MVSWYWLMPRLRRFPRNSSSLGLAFLLLVPAALSATAGVKLISPEGYLPGVPFLVRVEVRDESGTRDADTWDAEAQLSTDRPQITLSTNRVTLRNGLGTVLLTITGEASSFTLNAVVNSQAASKPIMSVATTPVTITSGTLPEASNYWSGVVRVTGTVVIPSGRTLTIAPGTTVLVAGTNSGTDGVSIIVSGAIRSLGTEAQPVTITSEDAGLNWGHIRHDGAQPSLYRHTFITKAGRAPGEGHTGTAAAIHPSNSQLSFESCVISDLTAGGTSIGKSMMADGATLSLVNCVLARSRMGPEIAGTQLLCTNSYFTEMRGPDDSDGIYLHDSSNRPLVLSGCVFVGGDDDAIDTLAANVLIENCILRDWPNPNEDAKGVSVFHGEVHLDRCLIVNCYMGVSGKSSGDLSSIHIDHCTISGIERGVSAAWKANATAGNIAVYITNSIVLAADAIHSDFGPEKYQSVTFCNLSESWPGEGNLWGDPMFIDTNNGNYRLLPGSPCIDGGDIDSPLDPDGSRSDIGFYRFAPISAGVFASITFPRNASTFLAPTNLTITVVAAATNSSIAHVDFYDGTNLLGSVASVPYTLDWPVLHVGTHTLQAVAVSSHGLMGTSGPVTVTAVASLGPATNTLVAAQSFWNYLDDGSNQGANWVQPDFDDSAWKVGKAKLGYGDGDEATVISYGTSASNKHVTSYFRHSFVVSDASRARDLSLRLLRDDGAIIYLNGQRIYSISMPSDVNHLTYASTATDYNWVTTSLAAQFLKTGTNYIAAEVHQGNASSSDLAFDLELSGVFSSPTNASPYVKLRRPATDSIFSTPANIVIEADALDVDGSITNVTFFADGVPLGQRSASPYVLSWSNAPAGIHQFSAVAVDNMGSSTTSPTVAAMVSTNSAPPMIETRLPEAGTVTNLSEITVSFTKAVVGVDAQDLLIDGTPARGLTGSGTLYTFQLSHPPLPGNRMITWATNHGIADTYTPPQAFEGSAPGSTWVYNCMDASAPLVKFLTPSSASAIPALTSIMAVFTEPVTGVDAADLLINGMPATSVVGSGPGPYTFRFPQPAAGYVTVAWATTHDIRDQAGNNLETQSWSYTQDPTALRVVINEILYHAPSMNPLEEYVEFLNLEPWPINLNGWRLTRGVKYTFTNATIPAGGYLVVAANLDTFRGYHPGVTNVVGNWEGALSNSGEDIRLEDANGKVIAEVRYADEGDWAIRRRSLLMYNNRGWEWSSEHDGEGKSLELINPCLPNNLGQNWAAGIPLGGTPGTTNSVFTNNIAPLISSITHAPVVPTSADPVVIRALISDESEVPPSVSLHYRVDALNPGEFSTLAMQDDGIAGDASAGDKVYSATLPAQAHDAVVEFYITATDTENLMRAWPAPAIRAADGFGPSGQVVNALYQVDDTSYTGKQPLYKIIMREAERVQLQAIMDNVGSTANSDAQMNGTFISLDGVGIELRYLVGVRNRGHGTRVAKPNNYRVNFRSDEKWKGVAAINLNAQFSWLQVLGATLHVKSLSLGAYSQAVQLRVNNANVAFTGSTDRTYGSYAANEVIDADWADHHFPNDGQGNVYRAVRDITPAEFDYRILATYPTLYGPDSKDSYTNTWFKQTNESEDDWTDLIGMLKVLGLSGSEPFTSENVRRVVNVEQWMRYLAMMTFLGNAETSPVIGYNDDYLLYRGTTDTRFQLMYYDLDTILGFNRSLAADASIFLAAATGTGKSSAAAFNRFMHHPDFEPVYYAALRDLLTTVFSAESLDATVDEVLGGFVPDSVRSQVKAWMAQRRAYVSTQLPADTNNVAPVATVLGVPRNPSPLRTATLIIGGNAVAQYSYRLNNGSYSAFTDVATPLTLSGLSDGPNQIAIVGKTTSGVTQSSAEPTIAVWVVDPALPAVRLNEVIASPGSGARDRVELYNEGSAPANLTGMRLSDQADQPGKYIFPTTQLAPGEYLVLDSSQLGFSLDASGEGVFLFNSVANGGALLDSVTFGAQIQGLSIGRIAAGGEWHLCQPSFGTANLPQPLGEQQKVRINEWLASGISPYATDFVELYNPNGLPVAVGDCYLTDQPVGAPDRSPIAPLSFIPAGGFLVFTSGNSNAPDQVNFGLSADQGELALFSGDLSLIHSVYYSSQQTGIAYGSCPDGANTFVSLVSPTPGSVNQCPVTPVLPTTVTLIPFNQVWHYNAYGTNLGTAWVQTDYDDSIWSRGAGLLGFEDTTLSEPILTPLANNQSITYFFRTAFEVASALAPSSLKLTYLIDDGAAFYINGVEFTPRFNLDQGADYQTEASVMVGNAAYQTLTVSPSMLQAGSNWIAVEVHQVTSDSSDMVFGLKLEALVVTNSSVAEGVLLNELLAENRSLSETDGSRPDWVELYNPSLLPADLTGMSLSDDPANPRRYVFPAGSLILGRGHLRLRCSPDSPSSDANSGFGLSANGGTLSLFNTPAAGGQVLDTVVYGLLAPDWSIGRVPDGGTNWALNLPTPGISNIAASLGDARNLRINEWIANPAAGEDWLELYNPNAEPADLSGLTLSDTLSDADKHRLPPLSFIGNGSGAFLQLVADESPAQGADHLDFKLNASGEAIVLASPTGVIIDAVSFGPQTAGVSQGALPDGSHQVLSFPGTSSPGAPNCLPSEEIFVNEILSHSVPPYEDAVELFNASAHTVDLGGWFLSDSSANPRKYEIPANTFIPPRGYVVFYQRQFNGDTAADRFSFSSAHSDEVHLSEASQGVLTGYRASASFGPAENGVPFGRLPTSQGYHFVAMDRQTFGISNPATTNEFALGAGAPNGCAKVGPIIINEIMYHPEPNDDALEYIELHNTTAAAVPLYDAAHDTNTWRLRGAVEFDFPKGTLVPAHGSLVIVGFDPTTNGASLTSFRSAYGNAAAQIGPYAGKLDNAGESVQLFKPDPPHTAPSADAGLVPYILVEQIDYSDAIPWPPGADGTGYSLHRVWPLQYGNDPQNWIAAAPTAGNADSDGDGMPDGWEFASGLNSLNPADQGYDRDADHVTNLDEYRSGTNPLDPISYLGCSISQEPGGGLRLEFIAAAGKAYVIEQRAALAPAEEWEVLTRIEPEPLEHAVLVRAPTTTASRFFRVRTD